MSSLSREKDPHFCFILQLHVSVAREEYSYGVVAVDNFELWASRCSMSALECDFESGSCGWKDDESYPLEWVTLAAREGAVSMGYDHTTYSSEGK